MNQAHLPNGHAIRHRLLEGFLLRLARLPNSTAFVLRGGMLMRLWFRPLNRPAGDLDLVATFPFSVAETERHFVPVLTDRSIDDGVRFEKQRFRIEGIWQNTDFPGVRLLASGEADGIEDEFNVDVTFGEPLVPTPEVGDYPMRDGTLTARLCMCRPETIVGRKLHALWHMGMLHWRPKDLNDVRLLLSRVPLDACALPEAIAASFTSRGDAPGRARTLFRSDWWTMKRSMARWHDFLKDVQGREAPSDLSGVVAEVGRRIDPVLEQLA